MLDVDGRDLQFVDIGAVVVFSIGDGGLKSFLDDASGLLLRERQDVESLVDLFATNQVGNQSAFVDREANASND
ncbi:hypothetical protein FQZ97_1225170 [compost metagenome]